MPFVVGHRHGNDIRLARDALAAGADALEVDIWLHGRRLELRHARRVGRLPLLRDEQRWSLTVSPILQLSRLLDAVGPQPTIMFDLKGPGSRGLRLARRAVAVSRERRPGASFLVCGRNWQLVDAFRPYPEARLLHSIGVPTELAPAWEHLERGRIDAVSIRHELLDQMTTARLRQHARVIVAWTVNEVERAAELLDRGIDGINTDSYAVMRFIRRRREHA